MGRPKVKDFWKETIRTLTAENESLNEPPLARPAIRARLEKEVKAIRRKVTSADLGPIPSLRAIGRIQHELRTLSEEDRRRYRQFHWPESMDFGALPWEAGPAALELLRWRRERKCPPPLIGQVRWFWRVSTLAPDAPFDDRYAAARRLFALEVAGAAAQGEDQKRSIELWLAFAPWRSEDAAKEYADALGGAPAFPHDPGVTILAGTETSILGEWMIALDGIGFPDAAHRAVADVIVQQMSKDERGAQ